MLVPVASKNWMSALIDSPFAALETTTWLQHECPGFAVERVRLDADRQIQHIVIVGHCRGDHLHASVEQDRMDAVDGRLGREVGGELHPSEGLSCSAPQRTNRAEPAAEVEPAALKARIEIRQ